MTTLFWIIGIIATIYLLLVIPAGIAVFISKRNYKNSPYKQHIDKIINEYRETIIKKDRIQLDNLVKNRQNEIIERDGEQYSVEFFAKRHKNKYKFFISVGKLKPITIGHAEIFEIVL
jgi:hypothetical protein